jgi:hypothetical protein
MRCRAAFVRKLVAVLLLGYMSVAIPVYLVVEGNSEGVVETLLGGCVWLILVGATIGNAFGLGCKMILDEEEVTFVESAGEIRLKWTEISAIEVGGDSYTWEVEIRTPTGKHRPSALKCMKWFGQPKSLRRAVETLERYRRAGRA